jgi:hypothetical protein
MPPGWAVGDGEFVNYSAQGKSGNERPDHRELDGRSLIGRQGMSDGESVSGSGKINEGDTHIDHRMTQDPVQSGQVQLEPSNARAVATGGGKLGGSADDYGMHGQGPHMDAPDTRGSMAGLQALLRRRAEQIATQADLQQVRTGSLPEAIRYMQKAETSLRRAAPIQQVHETQQKAAAALRRTQAGLAGEIRAVGTTPRPREEADAGQTAAEIDIAPARYRRVVSDYFKALGERNP